MYEIHINERQLEMNKQLDIDIFNKNTKQWSYICIPLKGFDFRDNIINIQDGIQKILNGIITSKNNGEL